MSEPTMRVEFHLAQDDRSLLTEILQELKNARPNCERCVQQMGEAVQNCVASHPADSVPPATAEDVAKAAPTKEEPKTVAAPAKAYTEKDVQDRVVTLIQKGKRAEAVKIIHDYAKKVSEVPADKRAEAIERMEEIIKSLKEVS